MAAQVASTSKSNRGASKAAKKIKTKFKSFKRQTLDEIAQKMHDAKLKNDKKLPHNFIPSILKEMNSSCPWLNRNSINYHYLTWLKMHRDDFSRDSTLSIANTEHQDDVNRDSTLSIVNNESATSYINQPLNNNKDRVKGGRPKGTTDAMKKAIADKLIAAKNEIAVRYKKVKDESENKPVSNGTLNKIIEYVKKEKKIPHDTVIKADTIRRRISRMRPHVLSSGGISPLISIEDSVVQIIIQMARIRQSLTPSKGLQLVNDMIHNTPLQTDLIKWKEKHTSNATDTLGRKYWKNFMRRHKDKIKSKRGAKYSLDRANWSTYTNFNDMYEHNYEEMEMAGVAVRLDEPVWKDRSGNIVEEADALGCKVTHDLIHPEMCIVGDEVGGNLNMDGDGHVGGTKLLCAKDAIPQINTLPYSP